MFEKIVLFGSLFSVFVFVHFFVDWVFQSHKEALCKHNNAKVRAKHCLIYSSGFVPLFYVLNYSLYECIIAFNILFWSHFYLDTYHLVYLWAKYIRKPPEMFLPQKVVGVDGYTSVLPPDPQNGFVAFVTTPLGKILMITTDQLSHLIFLIPVIYMAIN